MSVGLLLPSALLALAALLVPLLVHLVRQTEQTRIQFAALRWLLARAQPRRRPRFNEWLLLMLRLLLLALLALWLAQPVLHGRADVRPWLVVHPAISLARVPAAASQDEQRHWLAPGFPSLDQPLPRDTTSIASLLRELDTTLPAGIAVRVVVPEQFDATDTQRAALGRGIQWMPIPGTSSLERNRPPTAIHAVAYADEAHRVALPYLRAAAKAWNSNVLPSSPASELREIGSINEVGTVDTQLLWLASDPLPAQQRNWVQRGGVTLLADASAVASLDWQNAAVAWRSANGTPLALRMADGKGAWIRMLVPFDPQSLPELLEPTFPDALQALLEAGPPTAKRTWAESYSPSHAKIAVVPPSPRPIGALLALLIALLFGIERWLATAPRRWVAR
ncbi:MAG: BatA domain-containing protein [Thermomonas sp.]